MTDKVEGTNEHPAILDIFQKITEVSWPSGGILVMPWYVETSSTDGSSYSFSATISNLGGIENQLPDFDLNESELIIPDSGPDVEQQVTNEMLAAYEAWSYFIWTDQSSTSVTQTVVDKYSFTCQMPNDDGVMTPFAHVFAVGIEGSADGSYGATGDAWSLSEAAVACSNASSAAGLSGYGLHGQTVLDDQEAFPPQTHDVTVTTVTRKKRGLLVLNVAKLKSELLTDDDHGILRFSVEIAAQDTGHSAGVTVEFETYRKKHRDLSVDDQNNPQWDDFDLVASDEFRSGGDDGRKVQHQKYDVMINTKTLAISLNQVI